MNNKSNIGLIGLKVMGVNLALNLADNGYKVSIFTEQLLFIDEALNNNGHENFTATYSLKELVDSLKNLER